MTPRRRRSATTGRWLVVGLALVGTAVAGCDTTTAWPAIMWGTGLIVELADGWPPGTGRAVDPQCPGTCNVLQIGPGTPDQASAPLTGTSASDITGVTPESVVGTVVDATGTESAPVEAEPGFVRAGGSEGCGGPSEATVVVPAP